MCQPVRPRTMAFASYRAFCRPKVAFLNPTRPRWVHGKHAVVEPNGLLFAKPLAERVCSHFGCSFEAHLVIPVKVA
jgi:hypothetical protein